MADRRGVREQGSDAIQITIDYIKQETLGPVKRAGRFLAAGIASSFLVAIGTVLLLVGVLRLLQMETGLTGNLSWVPYLIVAGLGLAIMAIATWRIVTGPARRRLPEEGHTGHDGTGVGRAAETTASGGAS